MTKINYDRKIIKDVIYYKLLNQIQLLASIHIKIKDLWKDFNQNEEAIKILVNREEMYNSTYEHLKRDYLLLDNLKNPEEYEYLYYKYIEDIKAFNKEASESMCKKYHGAYQKLTKGDILNMEVNYLSLSKAKNI